MRKKRVLFHSDFALSNSGFGRNAKAVLSYLYSTGKYDILSCCCGMNETHTQLPQTPWKSVGVLPSNEKELEFLQRSPDFLRRASYGSEVLDKIAKEFKPDVYFGVQDIWGVDYSVEKSWFPKIGSAIWTTLDSLPILPSAVKLAPKIKNYWIWSGFATEALHDLGHDHVETLHGAIETRDFKRLPEDQRMELRRRNNISSDDFIVGYVFRNQLRKSVPNLLEGFKIFKNNQNDKAKGSKLLLHTNFAEGWNILRLADEYEVSHDDILTTLICQHCNAYSINKFVGQNVVSCGTCGAQKSMVTTNIELGVKEDQLNEVYNLMDVYCHPFTSGGQEIPIQEAKLTELVTLVTNYSCGEEMCKEEARSISLDFSEYREHNTEFRKASTDPNSIAEGLMEVYAMSDSERSEAGKQARQFVLDNYSKEIIGMKLEEFIDSSSFAAEAIFSEGQNKNPDAETDPSLDDSEWVKALYKNILDASVGEEHEGYNHWLGKLKAKEDPLSRDAIENYFRQVARSDHNSRIESYLSDEDEGKRILFVMPSASSEAFLITSLFESALETYPDHNIYVAAKKEIAPMLDGNPHIFKVIPYMHKMDDPHWLEGSGKHKGFFKVAFLFHLHTQTVPNYTHQGRDKNNFCVIK